MTPANPLYRKVHCVALDIGDDIYTFTFTLRTYQEMLRVLGKFAADPDLGFNWHHAAVLSQKIREIAYAGQQAIAATITANQLAEKHSRRW